MPKFHLQNTILAIAAAATGVSFVAQARATDILFVDILNFLDPDGNSIRRMGIDGNNLVTVIPTGGGARGMDVDFAAGKVYWTDVDTFAIRRANLDGSGQEDVIASGLAFPSALRLDVGANRMYWGDQTSEELWSTDLTTISPQLVAGTNFNRGLAIDAAGGKVYWTMSVTATSGRIMRSNLDGSDQQIVRAEGSSKPGNLALDVAAGKIYWSDPIARKVRRANLDGTNVEPVLDTLFIGNPKGIALDIPAGKIYIGLDVAMEESPAQGWIYRCTFDGLEAELIATGLGSVNDMIIVPDAAPCLADFDGNGAVQVPDIFAYLSAWFGNNPSADIDGTPGIGVPDIFAFLSLWFAGCP